jgi:hypothetical protein
MLQLSQALHANSFLIDLAISITGLSFICALTYAMRWLPGRVMGDKNALSDFGKCMVDLQALEAEPFKTSESISDASKGKIETQRLNMA